MQIKHHTIGTECKSNFLQLVQDANNTSYDCFGMEIEHPMIDSRMPIEVNDHSLQTNRLLIGYSMQVTQL